MPGRRPAVPSRAGAAVAARSRPWSILVTGIGGTGVVTVGHILGMAAHLEGKGCGIIDMAGLSQKSGAVVPAIRIAAPEDIHPSASRPAAPTSSSAVISSSPPPSAFCRRQPGAAAVVNCRDHAGEFTRNADFSLPAERLKRASRRGPARENPISSMPPDRDRPPGQLHRRQHVPLGYA